MHRRAAARDGPPGITAAPWHASIEPCLSRPPGLQLLAKPPELVAERWHRTPGAPRPFPRWSPVARQSDFFLDPPAEPRLAAIPGVLVTIGRPKPKLPGHHLPTCRALGLTEKRSAPAVRSLVRCGAELPARPLLSVASASQVHATAVLRIRWEHLRWRCGADLQADRTSRRLSANETARISGRGAKTGYEKTDIACL